MRADPAAGGRNGSGPAGQMDHALAGRRFFSSWSGGKDAYLAFARAVAAGGRPEALVCMLNEDGGCSRGHGLPVELLEAQATSLGVPLVTGTTSWDDYEAAFVGILHELKRRGAVAGVFGDIDLEGHRVWVEEVCGVADLSCHLPLWHEPRRRLINELLASGVRATVVAVDASRLDASFLGREITPDLVAELEAAGADACGEEGEYHTVVTSSPLFSTPVPLAWSGREERDGHWVLKFSAVEVK